MNTILLSNGIWTLEVTTQGHIVALRNPSAEFLTVDSDPVLCEISHDSPQRTLRVTSAHLVSHSASSAVFETDLDLGNPLTLRFGFALPDPDAHGTAVKCTIQLLPGITLGKDVRLKWFLNIRLPGPAHSLFAPLFDGRGLRTSRRLRQAWHYVCAGGGGEGDRLALPLINERSAQSPPAVAYFADPFFSTGITLPPNGSGALFECLFLGPAGPQQFPERMFGLYLHDGDDDEAIEGFFQHAIPNCVRGPGWLHNVAMVHYDYLSEKGEGWFRDIDRLVELIPPDDRARLVLTLHGWYDLLGRYCFDEESQKLDARWTVMPQGDRSEMSLEEMHRRIAYARARGFRVLLYFADGMAIDSGAPNYGEEIVFREPDGTLRKHHWAGPDTITQTYVMNPLHPRVENFFRGYTRALLDEFGSEIDGLTWDETFTTRLGDLSRGMYPGYADRAFMLLCSELRNLIKARNPELAFLASDCTGLRLPQEDGSYWSATPAQNALLFDGTYQDSQCSPAAWQYGLFPNYRNVLWSCNWQPTKNFEWTALGVRAFGAPAAISNGWGENKGISRYSEQETDKIMELFRFRKALRGKIRWIECREE
jgi:hypothetical protein